MHGFLSAFRIGSTSTSLPCLGIISVYLALKTLQDLLAGTLPTEHAMKWLLTAMILGTCVLSYSQNTPKVLLFLRNGQSGDLEYVLKKEVGVMKNTLERSGYRVVVATL